MNNSPHGKQTYRTARDVQLACFRKNFDAARLKELGCVFEDENTFFLPMLNMMCRLEMEPFSLSLHPRGRELDMTYQVLLLDYLSAAKPQRPRKMISFADFPEARGYLNPYQGRVLGRLTHGAGRTRENFVEAALRAGGEPAGSSPQRFLFRFFPLFELQAVRYEADEDFPHGCSLLFSDNALHLLSVESLIVCAEKLVSVMHGKMP